MHICVKLREIREFQRFIFVSSVVRFYTENRCVPSFDAYEISNLASITYLLRFILLGDRDTWV